MRRNRLMGLLRKLNFRQQGIGHIQVRDITIICTGCISRAVMRYRLLLCFTINLGLVAILVMSIILMRSNNRICRQDYHSIKAGMTKDQVEAILGQPDYSGVIRLPAHFLDSQEANSEDFLVVGEQSWWWSERTDCLWVIYDTNKHAQSKYWIESRDLSPPRRTLFDWVADLLGKWSL